MGHKARYRPKRLPLKLRKIRRRLGMSQSVLARSLNVGITTARISEYESGAREPGLITLLSYARVAGVTVEQLIDDKLNLPTS